jgi:hypothetical protein
LDTHPIATDGRPVEIVDRGVTERKARGRDVAELRLSTNSAFASNIRLYRSVGYRIDRREPFMGGEAVYMSKKIASP